MNVVKPLSGTMANKVTILSSRNLESRELSVSQGPQKNARDTETAIEGSAGISRAVWGGL